MTLLLEMRIVMNCPLPMVDCPPRLQGLAKTCKDTAEVKTRCCLSLGVHVLSSWPSTVPNIASLGATSTSPRYHFQGGGCPDQNGHQPHPPPPRGVIIASYCIRDIMRYCNMVLLKTTVYTVWLWPAAHGIGRKLAILRFTRQRRHRAALLKPGFNGRFGIPYTPSSAIASPMSYYCSCYFRLHKPLPFFSLSISLSLAHLREISRTFAFFWFGIFSILELFSMMNQCGDPSGGPVLINQPVDKSMVANSSISACSFPLKGPLPALAHPRLMHLEWPSFRTFEIDEQRSSSCRNGAPWHHGAPICPQNWSTFAMVF